MTKRGTVLYDSQYSTVPYVPDFYYYKCFSAMKTTKKIFVAPCYLYDANTWKLLLLVSLMTSRCGKLYFLLVDEFNNLDHVFEPKYNNYVIAPDVKVDMQFVSDAFKSFITGDRK
jgi:hypothetical protein